MNIDQIIHNQLDVTIANPICARARSPAWRPMTLMKGQQIESAAFYLEDIRYNWLSLLRSQAVRHPPASPNREA